MGCEAAGWGHEGTRQVWRCRNQGERWGVKGRRGGERGARKQGAASRVEGFPRGPRPGLQEALRSGHAATVGPQGAPASLTSGWARALVSSTAHAAGEEGGTPGNDAPPLSVTSPAHRSRPLALIGSPPKDGTLQWAGPVLRTSTRALPGLRLGLGGPGGRVRTR